MRDGAEHVEGQLAGGRRGVDLLLEAEQGHATALQLLDDGQQLGEGPTQTVKAHDRQGVVLRA
jgi:hypothetical protein